MSIGLPPSYQIAGGKESHYVTIVGPDGSPGGGGTAAAPSVSVGLTTRLSGEISRPAGALTYAASQMVGSLVTIPNVGRVAAGTGYVVMVRLSTQQAIPGTFRVYVWNQSPAVVPAD